MTKKQNKRDIQINNVPYKSIKLRGADGKPSYKLQPKCKGNFSTIHFKLGDSHVDKHSNQRTVSKLPEGTAVIIPIEKGNNEIKFVDNWIPGATVDTPSKMKVSRKNNKCIVNSSTSGDFVLGYVPKDKEVYIHKD